MTDKLAQAFDAALQKTASLTSNVGVAKTDMAATLASLLQAAHGGDALPLLSVSHKLIDVTVERMRSDAERIIGHGITDAQLGAVLESPATRVNLINKAAQFFAELSASIRAEQRAANDGIIRDNSAYKEGIALGGKVYPAHP